MARCLLLSFLLLTGISRYLEYLLVLIRRCGETYIQFSSHRDERKKQFPNCLGRLDLNGKFLLFSLEQLTAPNIAMEFLRITSEGKHRRGSFEPNAFAVVFHSFSVKLKAQPSNLSAQEWIVNQDCFKFDVSRRICSIQIHGALSQHKRT